MFLVLASPRVRVVCLALVTACGEAGSGSDGSTTGSESGGSGEGGEASTGVVDEAPPTACAAATTVVGSPRTISEAVEYINALPRPLTLDCVLERLARPLAITSTRSVVSLQPAVGSHSPRVFIFLGSELVVTITVGDMHGFDLLEFGEVVAPARSIKAEVGFPVEAPLDASAPFLRVRERGGENTNCAICHRGEAAAPEYPFAFASNVLRFPVEEEVTLDALRDEHARCDPLVQPRRCARLTALFGHGPVESAAFPDDLPTIYDQE